MCGPQWTGFCAEMFKWFVVQLGAGETRAQKHSVPECVGRPGKDAPLIRRLQARRAAAEGGSLLGGLGPPGAPREFRDFRKESSVPAEKAGSTGPGDLGAAGRGARAFPGAQPRRLCPPPGFRPPTSESRVGWGALLGDTWEAALLSGLKRLPAPASAGFELYSPQQTPPRAGRGGRRRQD